MTVSLVRYDKKGRLVEVGDVLKVYHFTGGRRKKYYMYKLVMSVDGLGKCLSIGDIAKKGLEAHSFSLICLGDDIEIVETLNMEKDT